MATYYVNATDGDDSKVNSSMGSFSAGDSILFKRGETWSGTSYLYITCSGAQGNVITFGAYGSGNKPKIETTNTDGYPAVYIRASGLHDVKVENIEARATADNDSGFAIYDSSGMQRIYIDNVDITSATGNGIFIKWVDTFEITNCSLSGFNDSGIVVYGSASNKACNGTISGNTIDGSSSSNGDGITLHDDGSGNYPGSNFTIADNAVSNCPEQAIDACCAGNLIIENNDCSANSEGSIVVGGGTDGIDIRYNYFHDENDDGIILGTVYNADIYYNIIYDWTAYGLYFTASGNNINVYNNTFVATSASNTILNITDGYTNVAFKNNIFASNNSGTPNFVNYTGSDTPSSTSHTYDYNCYWNPENDSSQLRWNGKNFTNWKSDYSEDANSIYDNPDLINVVSENFALQGTSPCIDAGTDVSLTSDYNGSLVPMGDGTPDIGAVEYARFDSSVLTLNISLPAPTITADQNQGGQGMDLDLDLRI